MMLLRMAVSQTRHFPHERKVRVPSRKKRGRRKMLAEYAPGPSASHRPRIARHADPSATRLRSEEELKGGAGSCAKGAQRWRCWPPAGRSLPPQHRSSRHGTCEPLWSRSRAARDGSTSAGPRLQCRSPSDIHSSNARNRQGLNPRRQSTNFRDGHSASNVVADLYMGQSAPLPRLIHLKAPPISENSRCRRCLWPASPPHPSV
jgi:hypothetical protein